LIALETTFHAQKEDYKSDRGGMLFRGHDTSPFAIECINVAGLKQGAVHQLAALHGVEQPGAPDDEDREVSRAQIQGLQVIYHHIRRFLGNKSSMQIGLLNQVSRLGPVREKQEEHFELDRQDRSQFLCYAGSP
jgi:hypothetical protein